MRRVLVFVVVTAALAGAGAWYLGRSTDEVGRASASVPRHEPRAGDPPVVWVAGELEEVGADRIVIRDGDGPVVELQRLAARATSFLRAAGDGWAVLEDPAGETGSPACVEAFLDGERFVAIRVFVGASGCGPG